MDESRSRRTQGSQRPERHSSKYSPVVHRRGAFGDLTRSKDFDNAGYGEVGYLPLFTQLVRPATVPRPEDLAAFKRLVIALAEHGLYFGNSHVEMDSVIDAMLDVYDDVNKTHPLKGLRWSFAHLDKVTEAQLVRMKRLGVMAQLHSRPLIQGALMHQLHGERAWDMPPFRRVQDSGIHWDLGSVATAGTPSNPFCTLSFAITGEMIGGRKQSISREEALIAHTRSNAAFLFQENKFGSLASGKYAELLILDRDYLTVPVSEIKGIEPLLTVVGGKVVYEANPGSTALPDRRQTSLRTTRGRAVISAEDMPAL